MRTRNPDNCLRAVKKALVEPEGSLEAALWNILKATAVPRDEVVYHAYEIYTKMAERECLQAWIIAHATNDEIRTWLRIPPEVTKAYRYLFFDILVFRDELDVLSWISEYERHDLGTDEGVDLLQTALREGVDKLSWVFGRGKAVMDPMVVQEKTMTDAFHRSRAHLGEKLSSKQATVAHAFMGTAVKVAQVLGKTGAPDVNSLILRLKHRDLTENVDDVTATEEILH